MNMFVSTAAIAAAPAVAAPPNSPDVVIDHRAILARVEEIIDLLRTRHIRDGWKMDEEGATRALAYFRRHVDGPRVKDEDEDTSQYYQAVEFFRSHGQSLDWIHDGNPSGMICTLAFHSQQANASAEPQDDAALLAMEEKIFEQHAAAATYRDEIIRLHNIRYDIFLHLDQETKEGRCDLTKDELWTRLKELPESKEHDRLVKLQDVHFTKMDKLTEKMWATPAHTSEGRRAKLEVLLTTIMPDDWREHDGNADYDINRARDLMFEFVGGEQTAQLRDQFAA